MVSGGKRRYRLEERRCGECDGKGLVEREDYYSLPDPMN